MSRPGTPTVLRSRSQLVGGVGLGIVFLALGLIGASQATYTTGKIGEAVVAIVVAGAMIALVLRAAVVVREDAVEIRNPFGTRRIPWSDVVRFRIGHYRLLSAVCIVDLRDGSTQHAFAIQLPRASRRTSQSKEMQMISFLNEQASAHRTMPAQNQVRS
jgi:Bacterial PH domain